MTFSILFFWLFFAVVFAIWLYDTGKNRSGQFDPTPIFTIIFPATAFVFAIAWTLAKLFG